MAEHHRQGGLTTQRRYGSAFLMAHARDGLEARELAKVLHPENLTPEQVAAIKRQVWLNQAALMRAARARNRAAAKAQAAE